MAKTPFYPSYIAECERDIALLEQEFCRLCNLKSAHKRILADAIWNGAWALQKRSHELFQNAKESGELLYCHPGYGAVTAQLESA
jgi:hypothetical protein